MEFLFFFPFLVLLLITMLKFASAINGSINQQKAVRSYFFHLIKNNSNLPNMRDLEEYGGKSLNVVRMSVLGWRNKKDAADNSFAPCYEMPPFIGAGSSEKCEDRASNITRFIRVFTAFGVCSTNYRKPAAGNEYSYQFDYGNNPGENFCMIGN